jgi:hypothetical protein
MDIDDVPNSGQPMSTGKKPPTKRKPKVLSNELLVIMDCAAKSCQVCHPEDKVILFDEDKKLVPFSGW